MVDRLTAASDAYVIRASGPVPANHRECMRAALEAADAVKKPRLAGLTATQQRCVQFIENFSAEHGSSPSYREIGAAVGLASVSGVYSLIERLEERGAITKLPGQARSLLVCR